MENMTTTDLIKALKSMTAEQRIEALRAARPELFEAKQVVSFGKAPKDGWKDEDRVK